MERIFQRLNQIINGPEIAIFHEFHKPPYGGGNQFLIALEKELKKRGQSVGRNKVGNNTKIVLFNSFNFDFDKLKGTKKRYPNLKMIHRVDGPISTYRGESIEIDKKIYELNHDLADKTIFQSNYSLNKHHELGLDFKNASVITNAVDQKIFNANDRKKFGGKIKLIATSWSNNPQKGGPTLAWLDEHLDTSKYELTFVGRTKNVFKNTKVIDAVPSEELAQILKQNDIYIAPSENDPCSNALLEALACGLPSAYRLSGGHPELVGGAGEPFTHNESLILAIDKIASNHAFYEAQIKPRTIAQATDQYLKIFT